MDDGRSAFAYVWASSLFHPTNPELITSPNPSPNNNRQQVGVDVAAHVQAFLSKADLGVRMTGADGLVLDAVRGSG